MQLSVYRSREAKGNGPRKMYWKVSPKAIGMPVKFQRPKVMNAWKRRVTIEREWERGKYKHTLEIIRG